MKDISTTEDIDLRLIFAIIWSGKISIVTSSILFTIVAFLYAYNLPNVYKAEVLLSPVHQETSGFGGLTSQMGGLASIAGLSLGREPGENKTKLGIEVLKSRLFFESFSENNNVLIPLFAAKNWNPESMELVLDDKIYDQKTQKWVRPASSFAGRVPSIQEAHKAFLKTLNIIEDKDSGLFRIEIIHVSPVVAKNWVDKLIIEINENIRKKDVNKAINSIDFLKEQISNTQLTELRSGLYELIQSQTETIMLANASPEYLFQTIDPAVVSEQKFGPNRVLIIILGNILGAILGVLFVFFIQYKRKNVSDS
ncbi:MAG: Wzz/FepE/Etk N-terminal domain-containing protein [Hellea sp.]